MRYKIRDQLDDCQLPSEASQNERLRVERRKARYRFSVSSVDSSVPSVLTLYEPHVWMTTMSDLLTLDAQGVVWALIEMGIHQFITVSFNLSI